METSFVMIKPDGVQRRLIGRIIDRFESAGLKISAIKLLNVKKEKAEEHYAVHKGKPFYDGLIKYITSGPVVVMIVEGENAIQRVRRIVGKTNPQEANPGTIRGDFCQHIGRNAIHASDGPETATMEIKIWFPQEEIASYTLDDEGWIYE